MQTSRFWLSQVPHFSFFTYFKLLPYKRLLFLINIGFIAFVLFSQFQGDSDFDSDNEESKSVFLMLPFRQLGGMMMALENT